MIFSRLAQGDFGCLFKRIAASGNGHSQTLMRGLADAIRDSEHGIPFENYIDRSLCKIVRELRLET
eukprot:28408-Amorphochlora_amoeboformis.AAC.2